MIEFFTFRSLGYTVLVKVMEGTMLLLLIGLGCNSDQELKSQGIGSEESKPIEYTLEVTSPVYGSFYQDGPIPVQGKVSPSNAELFIEGVFVETQEDGSFSYEVPFTKQYEIVEVEVPQGEFAYQSPCC